MRPVTDRPRRVYVVQRPAYWDGGGWVDKYDLSAAEEHGRLVYLLPPGNQTRDMGVTLARLRHRLVDYEPGDHLLAVGCPVSIAAAAMVAGAHAGTISVLRWDRHARRYEAYRVSALNEG